MCERVDVKTPQQRPLSSSVSVVIQLDALSDPRSTHRPDASATKKQKRERPDWLSPFFVFAPPRYGAESMKLAGRG
jgi:hypothetical protein